MSNSRRAHIYALRRRFARPLHYLWIVRAYDGWIVGRADADAKLAHDLERLDQQPSASLRHLDSLKTQRAAREQLRAIQIAAPLIDQRRAVIGSIAQLEEDVETYTAQLAEQAATEQELGTRYPSEDHLAADEVRSRRVGEVEKKRLGPIRRKLSDATSSLAALQKQLAELDAQLQTLHEGLIARVTTITHYYETRAQTQIRAYLRRTPETEDATHPLNRRDALAMPSWATEPLPVWLTTISATHSATEPIR